MDAIGLGHQLVCFEKVIDAGYLFFYVWMKLFCRADYVLQVFVLDSQRSYRLC